jgi:gliding motility-associated-like protein
VTDTFYVHRNLSSFAGCYRVAAVDRSGNLSTITDPICKDNCPVYVLPNVFTPNDDGTNDLFAAITRQDNDGSWLCPRFVESVKFKVYNRWGVEVYNSELDSRPGEFSIMINWDGRNNSGIEVPTGVYYYTAEIKYQALNPNRSTYEMKGWVHILR